MAVILASNAPVGLNKGKPVQTNTSNLAQPAVWTRPADWVSFTTPSSSEQKVIGIVAVYDVDSNYIAFSFTVTGGYTVDWGDGTSTTHSSGTTAQKNYAFSDLSSSTLSSRGYRQAVITVTPTTEGETFSVVDFAKVHTGITYSSRRINPWLDIAIAAPNATTIRFVYNTGGSLLANMSLCEQVAIVSHNMTTTNYLFASMINLQSVPLFDTSSVTNMEYMFRNCYLLQSVPLFDTSSVGAMSYMLSNCYSLESVPHFDTSSVSLMMNMFNGCYSLKSVPLFDTSSVTSMSAMFYSCGSLTSVPLFDTSSVTSMSSMFYDCASLTSVPLFDTSSVTNMSSMFSSCRSLVSVPQFDTSSVTSMSNMFEYCYSLESVPLFNTSSVTSMSLMFRDCFSLDSVPQFDTSLVTSMSSMFNGCRSLVSVPQFDTSSVTSMSNMFYSCGSLTSVPLFDTSSVTNMSSMLSGCRSLVSVPLFDTSSVTTMSSMFGSSSEALQTIPELNLSKISSATNNNMGLGASSGIAALNVAQAKLTGMRWTQSFQNCCMGATQLDEMYTALATLNPNITNVTSTGSVVTYTVDDIRAFVASRTVTITGVDPVAYNLTNVTVGTVTAGAGNTGTFTVTNAATGTYVSGGVAALQDNRTITVTGNPGVAGDDPTIAQNKGWTVTG